MFQDKLNEIEKRLVEVSPKEVADWIAADTRKSNQYFVAARLDSYIYSYPMLLSFFKDGDLSSDETMIQGVHMIYGWMPKVIIIAKCQYDSKQTEVKRTDYKSIVKDARDAISRLKDTDQDELDTLSNDDLNLVCALMNNSMVGASKLLHFINPDKFPIWDSKINNFIMQKEKATMPKEPSISRYTQYEKKDATTFRSQV